MTIDHTGFSKAATFATELPISYRCCGACWPKQTVKLVVFRVRMRYTLSANLSTDYVHMQGM